MVRRRMEEMLDAAVQEAAKPQCGAPGGAAIDPNTYDLPLHVAALFLVLLASIFGAGFPVAAKKLPWLKIPPKVFFACKHFGTGVLVATAFVHLLPVAFDALTNECLPDLFTKNYPAMPGVIMMAAMFALFVIEMVLNHKMGGQAHSHGGPTGSDFHAPPPRPMQVAVPAPPRPPRYNNNEFEADDIEYEKKLAQKMFNENSRYQQQNPFADEAELLPPSEMPPWFVVFYEQYVRQRIEMLNLIKSNRAMVQESYPTVASQKRQTVVMTQSPFDEEAGEVDPLMLKKMNLNITLLEGGILFHSIFVGITVSLTVDGFIILLVAIMFHQMFEGLGLGSRIAAVPYPKSSPRPWLLVFAFGTTAPIGMAIGLATQGAFDPDSAVGLIMIGTFNAISSGLLLYAAMVDLLAEDFLSEEAQRLLSKKDKIHAFSWVLCGAAAMSIVGAFA